jgi:outer membrane receptor for ferric coprogen and ferric-rhodotorulic acid
VLDPFHWDARQRGAEIINYAQWRTASITEQSGVYAGTRLRLADPLSLVLGGRRAQATEQGRCRLLGGAPFTPYAGVVYDLDKQHSVYASWTEIFQPQASTDANAQPLKPISGTNYEAGVRRDISAPSFLQRGRVPRSAQNQGVDDLAGPNPCPSSTWAIASAPRARCAAKAWNGRGGRADARLAAVGPVLPM